MSREALTRRFFLQASGSMVGTAMMRAGIPAFLAASQTACTAREDAAAFKTLSEVEAREIIAIAARILPTTDTPGATEAGAVYFFDTAFSTFFAGMTDMARQMLAGFQNGVAQRFPGTEFFSDLDVADQDAYLESVQSTPFFQGARFMTIAGVFGMGMYGGNRDDIGWKLVGMDGPPHAWVPPFGYYDEQYMAEQAGEQQDGN